MQQRRIYEGFHRLDLEERRIGKRITLRRAAVGLLVTVAIYYAVVLICLGFAPIPAGSL